MEYLSAAVFSPYFENLKEFLDESETLSQTRGGIVKQAAYASAGSIIGGIVGGPFGAMIGGIAGAVIGFANASSYRTIFFLLNQMADDERREVLNNLRRLMSLNAHDIVSRSVSAVTGTVTSYVSNKSSAIKNTVTGGVTSATLAVTGAVTSVTGRIIYAPISVTSYMYRRTSMATTATASAVTGFVTESLPAKAVLLPVRAVRQLANKSLGRDLL